MAEIEDNLIKGDSMQARRQLPNEHSLAQIDMQIDVIMGQKH